MAERIRTLIAKAVKLEIARQLEDKPGALAVIRDLNVSPVVNAALDALADQPPEEARAAVELIKRGAVKVYGHSSDSAV